MIRFVDMTKEKSFVQQALMLIGSNMTTGLLGFIYSTILSRRVGPEGMGLYGLIFPINSLLLSVITGGMMVAITKVIAEYYNKKNYTAIRKTMFVTLSFNLVMSILLVIITYSFSFHISLHIIKDIRTLYGLRLILISTVFMAVSNTFKGYFIGTSRVIIPAFIDIGEKSVRIILLLIFFKVFTFDETINLVTVSFLIFTLGELFSLIFLFLYYRFDTKIKPATETNQMTIPLLIKNKKLNPKNIIESQRYKLYYLKRILKISIPLMLSELIASSLYTVSSILVPRRLTAAGIHYIDALQLIGKFTSMSMQVVFFPMFIIGSVNALLVPDLTKKMASKQYDEARLRIQAIIRLALQIGLGMTIITLLLGDRIGVAFYKQEDLGPYIRFLGYLAPLLYLSSVSRGILNGLGKQNILLRNTILFSIVEDLLVYILIAIPSINIYGMGIAMASTACLTILVNFREINKTLPIFTRHKEKVKTVQYAS